jgi:hypothetical protein
MSQGENAEAWAIGDAAPLCAAKAMISPARAMVPAIHLRAMPGH